MGASGLGNLLVKEGFLTEQDRHIITRTCGHSSWAFAKSVLTMGLLDEAELAAFVAERTRFVVAPKDLLDRIDPNITKKIDKRLVCKLELLPIEMDHYRITVAVVDPLDRAPLKQLEFFTGLEIVPIISPISQIYAGLVRLNPEFQPDSTALANFLQNHSRSAWVKQRLKESPHNFIPAPPSHDGRQGAKSRPKPPTQNSTVESPKSAQQKNSRDLYSKGIIETPRPEAALSGTDFSETYHDSDSNQLSWTSQHTDHLGETSLEIDFDEQLNESTISKTPLLAEEDNHESLWNGKTEDTTSKHDEYQESTELWPDEEETAANTQRAESTHGASDVLDVLGSLDADDSPLASNDELPYFTPQKIELSSETTDPIEIDIDKDIDAFIMTPHLDEKNQIDPSSPGSLKSPVIPPSDKGFSPSTIEHFVAGNGNPEIFTESTPFQEGQSTELVFPIENDSVQGLDSISDHEIVKIKNYPEKNLSEFITQESQKLDDLNDIPAQKSYSSPVADEATYQNQATEVALINDDLSTDFYAPLSNLLQNSTSESSTSVGNAPDTHPRVASTNTLEVTIEEKHSVNFNGSDLYIDDLLSTHTARSQNEPKIDLESSLLNEYPKNIEDQAKLNPQEEAISSQKNVELKLDSNHAISVADDFFSAGSDLNLMSIITLQSASQQPSIDGENQSESSDNEDDDIKIDIKNTRKADDENAPLSTLTSSIRRQKKKEEKKRYTSPAASNLEKTHNFISQLSLCLDSNRARHLANQILPTLTKEGCLISISPTPQILIAWHQEQIVTEQPPAFLKFVKNMKLQANDDSWKHIHIPRSARWIGKSSEFALCSKSEGDCLYVWMADHDPEASPSRDAIEELIVQLARKIRI